MFACVAVLTTAAVGCGDVHFLPAPFTPQKVELVYSAQEHLTIVRWRVDAAPSSEVRFEMLGPDGYQPDRLFALGVCGWRQRLHRRPGQLRAVRRPRPRTRSRRRPSQFRPIRAVHERYGELPGGHRQGEHDRETFSMMSFFNFENDPVFVNLRRTTSPRRRLQVSPAVRARHVDVGRSVPRRAPPDGVVFYPLDLDGRHPTRAGPLTDRRSVLRRDPPGAGRRRLRRHAAGTHRDASRAR